VIVEEVSCRIIMHHSLHGTIVTKVPFHSFSASLVVSMVFSIFSIYEWICTKKDNVLIISISHVYIKLKKK